MKNSKQNQKVLDSIKSKFEKNSSYDLLWTLDGIPKSELELFAHKKYSKERNSWIRKLNSGRLKQTKNKLTTLSSEKLAYCCLGVLCTLGKRSFRKEGDGFQENCNIADYALYSGNKLTPFQDFLNLSSIEDIFILLNDEIGLTFKEIAFFIKEIFLPAIRKDNFTLVKELFNPQD